MKCEEFGKYLDNYELLTEEKKNEMNFHAANCEACKAELDFFLSIISAARTLPKIEPPEDFMAKLNDRLDAEDNKVFKPSKIAYHIKRNWKQYAAAAACFALVATLTANRGILLDRIEGTEDGVITEEAVETPRDNAAPDAAKPKETPSAAQSAQTNDAAVNNETAAATDAAAPITPSTSVAAARPARRVQPAPEVSNAPSRGVSAPVNKELQEPVSVPETSAGESYAPATTSEGYSIALAGNIQNETASYDIRATEIARASKADENKGNYSLAVEADSIALGRYYRIDKDGNPVEEDNEPKAIGSLNISTSDADKAMDIILQYPHGEEGGTYTTDSGSFSLMLSMLSSEGISYTNYTPAGSGDVKFKIVFD